MNCGMHNEYPLCSYCSSLHGIQTAKVDNLVNHLVARIEELETEVRKIKNEKS
jgi:inhibitor of KinA sporulation pathway (predicted exonuclease)